MTTDTPPTSTCTDTRESRIFYASYLRSVKQLHARQRHLQIEAILDAAIPPSPLHRGVCKTLNYSSPVHRAQRHVRGG